MRRITLKVPAVLMVTSGGARSFAQESGSAPKVCRADDGCDLLPTGSTD